MSAGEIPTPVPGPGEVLLRPLRIGLKVDPENGGVAAQGIAGEVVQVGPGVEDILPGEHYAVQSIVGCGECEYCFSSRENLCTKAYHTHGFGEAGVYAELIVLPNIANREGCLIQLPEGIDPDSGLFVEPLAFCINGLNHVPIARSVHLVVIGAGLTGILCGIIGLYRNARRVTICDPDTQRIEGLRALSLPFDEIIAGGDEAVSRILADSPGGVEAVVIALPDVPAIRRAFALGAIGAHISFMTPVGAPSSIDPAAITRRELHVHGSCGASRADYIEARHMIAEGIVPAAQLISRRFPIQNLKSAIEYLADPTSHPLAISLEIQSQTPKAPERVEEPELQAGAGGGEPGREKLAGLEGGVEGEPQDWSLGLSDAEISETARRVREPRFDYGPGSDLGPSGELTPWPDLPPNFRQERDRKKRFPDRGRRRKEEGRRPSRPAPEPGRPAQRPPIGQAPEPRGPGGRGRRGGRGRGRREERPILPTRPVETEERPLEERIPAPAPPIAQERPPPFEPIQTMATPKSPPEPFVPSTPPPPCPTETEPLAPVTEEAGDLPEPHPSGGPPGPSREKAPAAPPPARKAPPREPQPRRQKPAARSTPSPAKPRSRSRASPKQTKETGEEKKGRRAAPPRSRSPRPGKAKGSEGSGAHREPSRQPRASRDSPSKGDSRAKPAAPPKEEPRPGKDPLSSWPDFWSEEK